MACQTAAAPVRCRRSAGVGGLAKDFQALTTRYGFLISVPSGAGVLRVVDAICPRCRNGDEEPLTARRMLRPTCAAGDLLVLGDQPRNYCRRRLVTDSSFLFLQPVACSEWAI